MADRRAPPRPPAGSAGSRLAPTTLGRLALRAAVTVGLVAATALLARFPLAASGAEAAIRLALRTTTARLGHCRPATAEELTAQPVHMRSPEVCAEIAPDYELEVTIDGERVLSRTVVPQGVRRTRPLAVDATLPVRPGSHRLVVRLAPVSTPGIDAAALAELPAAHLDETVDVPRGRILLVVLREGRLLVLNAAGGDPK